MGDKCKKQASIRSRRKFVHLLCPSFCRTKTESEHEPIGSKELAPWMLSEDQKIAIINYLELDKEEGFEGLIPYKLHFKWEDFMTPGLYQLWIMYIFGSWETIVPDIRKFCELIKGQWSVPLEDKVKTIISILAHNDDKIKSEVRVSKHEAVKYFYELMATYFRWLRNTSNPELLKWVRCDADLNENNLRMGLENMTRNLPESTGAKELRELFEENNILEEVLRSVIAMSFGLGNTSDKVVPIALSKMHTILDITQIVFLTSYINKGPERFEWEMLYSSAYQGWNWTFFAERTMKKGPTIVVVEDKDGWMFGCYASKSWRISSNFFGDDGCFLFRLIPDFKIMQASKENENFMLFSHKKAQNALAMGGTTNYYGLWVQIDKPAGRCENTCDTFVDYDCLSKRNNFSYVNLEVWRVTPRNFRRKSTIKYVPDIARTSF